MTTVDFILIIIAVVIMVVGLYLIIRSLLNRKKDPNTQALVRDKNGIPIIPRHERNLVEEPTSETVADGETVITPDRTHLQPVIHEDSDPQVEPQFEQKPFAEQTFEESQQPARAEESAGKDYLEDYAEDSEEDVFSSLASATEKLMPVIETADEPEFTDNSPMLDHHLLAEAGQDQNSPLNHAQENINITVMPKNGDDLIDGKTILSLVSQYGLKYGAMNMFHRYENKDGSGILWFSMMGIDREGITPFDLNSLPHSKYNGLVLFLSLPHPKATQGFDTMMSVVNLIANDLNAIILDENNQILTRERRHQLRNQLQEYQQEMRNS